MTRTSRAAGEWPLWIAHLQTNCWMERTRWDAASPPAQLRNRYEIVGVVETGKYFNLNDRSRRPSGRRSDMTYKPKAYCDGSHANDSS